MANGFLILDLSNPATILSGGGQIAPMRISISLDSTGKIPNSTVLWANDQVTPSGTSYLPRIEDSNGLVVSDLRFCPWVIQGTSPIDLSAMTCTNVGASYPQFSSASLTFTPAVQNANFAAIASNFNLITTGASVITGTLPTAVGISGQIFAFKKVDSGAGSVTVATTGGQTIDGISTYQLVNQYQYVWVMSDNAGWEVIANN